MLRGQNGKFITDFLQLTFQCLFNEEKPNLGKTLLLVKLSFIVQIADGDVLTTGIM